MADGLFDFFSRARGQERRAALEGLLTQFIPPELRPQLGLLAEATPTRAAELSGQAAGRMVQPGLTGWERMAAAGDMASNMAGVLAPAAAGRAVGMAPVQALEEAFTGLSMSPQMMAARDFGADESGALRLFHGSPHDFDKFSMAKIGTGEGAQAYGHGLYFAENEGVAKGYRDILAGSQITTRDGNIPRGELWDNLSAAVRAADPSLALQQSDAIARNMLDGITEAGGIKKFLRNYEIPTGPKGIFTKGFNAAVDVLRELDAKPAKGRMYEVNINADPADFLDWDKPLSEQPQVRNAVASVLGRSRVEMPDGVVQLPNGRWSPAVGGEAVGRPQGWPDKATAEQALKYMVEDDAPYLYGKAGDILGRQGNQPQIAAALRDQGVPGIRYLDAGSRGAGDGSRNYVIFDENLIEIVRKYGIAGAAAMLGLSQADVAQALEQQQQPQASGLLGGPQ